MQLTYPVVFFDPDLLSALQPPSRPVLREAGRRWEGGEVVELIAGAEFSASRRSLISLSMVDAFVYPVRPPFLGESVSAVLQIGRGTLRGQCQAWAVQDGQDAFRPITRLFLPGGGLASFDLGQSPPWRLPDLERHSRGIGGLGAAAFRNRSRLRIGIPGLGRQGCAVLQAVATWQAPRLVLVDPDIVERHNLGEGGFFAEEDIGHPKVHVWENWLAVRYPETEVQALAMSVTHREPLMALAGCDVIITCVDHPGPRLAAAAIAACYCRPLLDLGTHIPNQPAGNVRMGGDARLVLPDRCLLCLGAVDRESLGRSYLASPDFEAGVLNRAAKDPTAWQTGRRGSLHSLNQLTAAVGLRLLEDAAAGIINESTWCQINLDGSGRITTDYPRPPRAAHGQCACHLRGSGDAGLREFLQVLNKRAA